MAGGQLGGEAAALALDPATGLAAAIVLAMVLTAFALANRPEPARLRPPKPAPERLGDWFETEPFSGVPQPAERRAPTGQAVAVVAARIDHFGLVGTTHGSAARRATLERVESIMRTGLRDSDAVRIIPGEGFVIVLGGAREAEAASIAERLRRAFGRIRIPGLGGAMRMTMSFGVAEERAGEGPAAARARATSALDAAGADCVVLASEIEEVFFLPPPSAQAQAA